MNSRRSTLTNISNSPSNSDSRNSGNSDNRRQMRPNSYRGRRLPGPMLPPSIVPEESLHEKNKTNVCRIDHALAVLRSTKRQKISCNEGKEHQQQERYDAKKSLTPSSDQSLPIDPNLTKNNSTIGASKSDTEGRSDSGRTNGSWEWSLGILPPAATPSMDQQVRQKPQLSRITPILYPSMLLSTGYSTKNVPFLPGLATTTDYERQEA